MEKNSFAIPIAIIVAAGLIAGAIYFNGSKTPKEVAIDTDPTVQEGKPEIRQVDDTDHIRGNPNAPIMLVEYSDFDCPFCKNFHETMVRILEEYGPSGKVAWAYRHFPLTSLHPNAVTIAEASECVASLGGTGAFWKFADIVFKEKPERAGTDITRLPTYAEQAGVNKTAYEACVKAGTYKDKIKNSINEAIAAGGRGTPHTLVLVGDQSGIINGAQPYDVVKGIVDNLVKQVDGTGTVPAPEAKAQ